MPEEEYKSTQDQIQEAQPKEKVASVPGAEHTAETLIEPVVHDDPQQSSPPESESAASPASSIPTVQVDVAISQSDHPQSI